MNAQGPQLLRDICQLKTEENKNQHEPRSKNFPCKFSFPLVKTKQNNTG